MISDEKPQPLPRDAKLNAQDRTILALVEPALKKGRQVLSWYDSPRCDRRRWFELGRSYRPGDSFQGFLEPLPVDGAKREVMGAIQNFFYDQGESQPERFRTQLREFALGYFLRLSESRDPQPAPDGVAAAPPGLGWLSWRPKERDLRDGFCYRQLYAKRAADGEIVKFTGEHANDVMDIRRIGPEFEWVVLGARIFEMTGSIGFGGPNRPSLEVPCLGEVWLVIDRSFVFDSPNADGSSTCGVGYAMLKYHPDSSWPFAVAPGLFDFGIQLNRFHISPNGRAQAEVAFIVAQPKTLLDIGLGFDPLSAYISLANLMTLGGAARQLDISWPRAMRFIIYQHSLIIYHHMLMTLRNFREVSDWTDTAALPEWIRRKQMD